MTFFDVRVEQALDEVNPNFGFATLIDDQPRDPNQAMAASLATGLVRRFHIRGQLPKPRMPDGPKWIFP